MLDAIPTERPITPLLDSIDETEKLRELDVDQLDTLARELREFLLYSVGKPAVILALASASSSLRSPCTTYLTRPTTALSGMLGIKPIRIKF